MQPPSLYDHPHYYNNKNGGGRSTATPSMDRSSAVPHPSYPAAAADAGGLRDSDHHQQLPSGGDGGGLYFADGRRRIDYVFVFEKSRGDRRSASIGDRLMSANPVVKATKSKTYRMDAHRQGYDHDRRMEYYIDNLLQAGLQTDVERYGENKVVVKLHATWEALCREAEALRIRMPLKIKDPYLDASEHERRTESARRKACRNFWNLSWLKGDDDEVKDDDRVSWPFDRDHQERFLIRSREDFFTPIQRSEIVWHIMQSCGNDPHEKESRGIESLLEEGAVECAYPLHQGEYTIHKGDSRAAFTPRQRLHECWATAWAAFKPQPINRIREYFGEKVALYFAYIQFYTHSLLYPALFGLLAFLYGQISVHTNAKPVIDDICGHHPGQTGTLEMCPICQPPICEPFKMHRECNRFKWQYRLDNEATLIVSVLTVLWCAVFVKFWRRRQARLAVEWRTYDSHQVHTIIRPDYEERAGDRRRMDPITGRIEPYVGWSKRASRRALSAAITFLLLVAAAGCLIGLIAARIAMYKAFRYTAAAHENVEVSRWLAHLFMYIMVTIFEKGYQELAEKLTVMECPKTDSQFYKSLLWKTFVFALMVDFLPLAYAAWVKGRYVRTPIDLDATSEACDPGGCMAEVVELVAVLLVFRLVLGNILEFSIPMIKSCSTKRRERRRLQKQGSAFGRNWPQWLRDYHLDDLELDGISKELMEMMIQISFVVFFVPALTLAPLVCFINNIIEIRVDAANFLATHRRPTPRRVPNLEIWNTFLDVILKIGVLVNAALIAFTSDIVPRLFYKTRIAGGTFVGYYNYSMSILNISHWPELALVVEEYKEKLQEHAGGGADFRNNITTTNGEGAGEHRGAAARFARDAFRAAFHAPELLVDPSSEDAWIANMTECRYFDYRSSTEPYAKTDRYWHVLTYRLGAFALFAIGFYVVLYLIDRLIKDVPSDVEHKIKRHQYIMTAYLEQPEQVLQRVHQGGGDKLRSSRQTGATRGGGGVINPVYVNDYDNKAEDVL